MKTLEELKKEHYEAKAKLQDLVDLVNSEDFYSLSTIEKSLINQQRTGLELYVSSLTKQLYGKDETVEGNNFIWLSMLYGMMNASSGFGTSSNAYKLKDEFDTNKSEVKSETNESGCNN